MNLPKRIERKGLMITVVMAVLTALFYSNAESLAIIAGGGLAILNFRLSSNFLKKVISPGVSPTVGKVLAIFAFFLRYIMLGVIIYLLIHAGISPVFFIIGLSAVVGSIFLSYGDLKRSSA